jgi:hypothetical protein
MTGRRPLWVAKQHGHSITTMLNVYAAWTDDASEADLDAIKRALLGAPRDTGQWAAAVPICTAIDVAVPTIISARAATRMSDRPPRHDLALDLAVPKQPETQLPDNWWEILAGERDSCRHATN